MNGKRNLYFLVIAMTALTLCFPVSVCLATKPTTIVGDIEVFLTYQFWNEPAGNSEQFFRFGLGDQSWTGAITGDCVHSTLASPNHVNARASGHGIYTFDWATVTVDSISASGGLTIMNIDTLRWMVVGGTGELANLRGYGTFKYVGEIPGVALFTYTGELQFAP